MSGRDNAAELRAFKPLMHPAGSDDALASVLGDVQAGRWMGMEDLLADTQWDDPARCTRTLLMAKVAAGGNAVEQWLRERPGNPDALAMVSRIAVEHAVRAVNAGIPDAAQLTRRAVAVCDEAAAAAPKDPVPLLGRLALACAYRSFTEGPRSCPVPGPWRELGVIWRIDPGNREACHRMMAALAGHEKAQPQDAQLFARAAAGAPEVAPYSAAKVLPLYALVGMWEYRHRTRPDELAHLMWTTPYVEADIEQAWGWFRGTHPADRLVADLSHLAHALWASNQPERSAMVFDALGRHGSARPWESIALNGDGVAELVRVRTSVMLSRERESSERASRGSP